MQVNLVLPATGRGKPDYRMQEAAREFEALFVAEILKPLDRALGGGAGGILASMGRQSLASQLSGTFGIGNLLLSTLAPASNRSED
ncbi:MAG: hypothetical protein AB1445_02735 [Bacillota bacterium]